MDTRIGEGAEAGFGIGGVVESIAAGAPKED
jgi:hypothetical protein